LICAGIHHEARRLVVGNLGVHGANPADIVRDLAQVRPQLADVHSALPVLLEFEWRLHQLAGPPLRLDIATRQRLAIVLFQRRLGIETIDRRTAAVHEKENHTLDALRIIEFPGKNAAIGSYRTRSEQRLIHHPGECHHAEPVANAPQRLAPGNGVSRFV
jgi:hypothetical protein